MMGHQMLRFVGGPWTGGRKLVAPSCNEVGTCCSAETPPVKLPSDATYKRQKVVLADALDRYEETCMVDSRLIPSEAAAELHKLIVPGLGWSTGGPHLPRPLATSPLKVKIESSLIHSLGYDRASATLDVTFKDKKGNVSGVYRYSGVGPMALGDLLTAESIGGAYTKQIRGKYPCVVLS